MTFRSLTALLVAVALGGCATSAALGDTPDTAETTRTPASIVERYVSASHPDVELDSLASWLAPDGRIWLIASAKSSHQLLVFNAASGKLLRTIGSKGDAPGQFLRPNGVAIEDNLLFVAERDNHRVQVLQLPGFEPLGSFGRTQLRSPYGLWVNRTATGELEIYVTDSFMYGEHFDIVPPLAELDQRVRRYRVRLGANAKLHTSYLGSFGETTEPGALRIVESLTGDPANGRLLIADEHRSDVLDPENPGRIGSTLREYTFDGRYTGVSLPSDTFAADAEGVALWACHNGTGYWIAVDQREPLTIFHVFERKSLRPVGSFQGHQTSRSDGIALHAAGTPAFPDGLLAAIHDDQAVAAFDLGDIASVLGLSTDCSTAR